jgi:hypothetical protein
MGLKQESGTKRLKNIDRQIDTIRQTDRNDNIPSEDPASDEIRRQAQW